MKKWRAITIGIIALVLLTAGIIFLEEKSNHKEADIIGVTPTQSAVIDPAEVVTPEPTEGKADQMMHNNRNIMVKRADNWESLGIEPVIGRMDMAIIDGSTATIPITAEILRQFWGATDEIVYYDAATWHSTTHYAYINLIDREMKYYSVYDENYELVEEREGSVNLIFVTEPSEEEKQYAVSKGVELDVKPIAMDGFVFITHKNNPISDLTVEQIQGIYSGEITNWSQVGGNDAEIMAYQREPNSGSQTAMEQMVMKGKKMMEPLMTKAVIMDMGALVDAVAEYENGSASIGYTYYYYINNLYKNDNIKVISVDGIMPANDNLRSKAYPFSTYYYAVIRASEHESSAARKLRDFLLTEKGQQLIEMAGYCRVDN